jgi:prolyl-tRNA synthetase
MIARASQLFLPTLRDAPADAEAASHQLLVRGFIRQIGAGCGRCCRSAGAHMRIEQIIREEINAIGGQRCVRHAHACGALGDDRRIDVPILFHLNDSGGRSFSLVTHEESMTFWHERSSPTSSCRRSGTTSTMTATSAPARGLLRLREFIMKDSYTFDSTRPG